MDAVSTQTCLTDGLKKKFDENPAQSLDVEIMVMLPEHRIRRTPELRDPHKEIAAMARVRDEILNYIGRHVGGNKIDKPGSSYSHQCLYANLNRQQALAVYDEFSDNVLSISEDPRIK